MFAGFEATPISESPAAGDWSFGVAVGYERRSLGVDDSDASSDGSRFQLGLSARRSFGATEVSGSLALGHGRFDIDRAPLPGVSLDGDQRLWLVSGQIRAARSIELGNWSLKPRIGLGVDYLSMGDFSYSGTGPGGRAAARRRKSCRCHGRRSLPAHRPAALRAGRKCH